VAQEHLSQVEVLSAFLVGVELDTPLDHLPGLVGLAELEQEVRIVIEYDGIVREPCHPLIVEGNRLLELQTLRELLSLLDQVNIGEKGAVDGVRLPILIDNLLGGGAYRKEWVAVIVVSGALVDGVFRVRVIGCH